MKFDLSTIKKAGKDVAAVVDQNSPTILTALAVAGLVGTVIFAVKATPKAKEIIANAKEDLNEDISEEQAKEVKLEAAKDLAVTVAPAVIMGAVTTACIIGSNRVNSKRIAALSAAYKISESALVNYQDKVKALIGDKKEEKVREEAAKQVVADNKIANVIDTGTGDILCFDYASGRYFFSKPDAINSAVNEFNKMLLQEDYLDLNELYSLLNIPYAQLGDEFGWNVEDGLVELNYTSTLTPDNKPVLVVDFSPRPNWKYDKSEHHRW